MSEREWQPGASDAGRTADDRRTDGSDGAPPDARRGATDDANNVEGVQGAQGGRVERERPDGGTERDRTEERGEVF
jgi:hypothetical protein